MKNYWTPRYAFDKIRYLIFLRMHPNLPWITPTAIKTLSKVLNKNQVGLEIGAGRSTAWIAAKIKHLTSLEHNKDYFQSIQNDLSKNNIKNVHLVLRERNDASPETSDYINFLKQLNTSFDFILIDGIYREQCVEILLNKLNPGGILVLDDCQRFLPSNSRAPYALQSHMKPLTANWERFREQTQNWKQEWSCDGMRDTCIYFKP